MEIVSKQENDLGITLTCQEEAQSENWVSRDPETLWEKVCSFFGGSCGESVIETSVSEFTVFFPKEGSVYLTLDMCYINGDPVSYDLRSKLLSLLKIAEFKEKPVTQFELKK